ncbi:hypothetical protein JTB14_009661 [Gonioctena quinquepunctata]|nr:hypothetical protein JTB14_009661 [Gonioctena quinquepunctata]
MDSCGKKLNKVTESHGKKIISMALAINKELNCEKKLDGFDNLLRDKNRTYAELRPIELPITDPVAATSRNNISGYPIQETDMVDEDPEDVEMPDDTIPENFGRFY